MSQENFYILLDLDPGIQDVSAIEKAINDKQLEWSGMRAHPVKGNWAKKQLAMLPMIRKIMTSNPDKRLELAQEAQKILLRNKKEQEQNLNEYLSVMSAKGYVYESEIKKLLRKSEFKSITESELKKRIKVPIKKDDPNEKNDAGVKPIEASVIKQIEQSLNLLNKKNLYDFLSIAKTSSIQLIQKHIEEVDREYRKKAEKTAEVTAVGDLLGHCRKCFKDSNVRKRYDTTLDLQKFKKIERFLDIAGADEIIQQAEFDNIIQQSAKIGLRKEEVIVYIKQYVKKKRWALHIAPDSVINDLINCGICGSLNSFKGKVCSDCGFPLQVTCPDCKTVNASTSRICSKCSYSIGDMPNALPLISFAQLAIVEGDLSNASQYLNKANLFWKDHPDILKGKKQINVKQQEFGSLEKEIREQTNKRFFYTAQKILSEHKLVNSSNGSFAALNETIKRKVKESDDLVNRALKEKTGIKKESFFVQALQICKDCKEAIEGLRRTPPEMPKNLKIRLRGDCVDLEWSKEEAYMPVKFRVLRKKDNRPTHSKDGDVLVETTQSDFSDKSGVAGASYYYAIYSVRETTFSVQAAVSSLITIVREVDHVQAISGDQKVTLKWSPPKNIDRVEVWFKKNAVPLKQSDGVQLTSIRLDGAVHQNLINNQIYGYLIVPVFKDTYGKEVFGKGTSVRCKPFVPPQIVEDLNVVKLRDHIEIKWRPLSDNVELYYSNTAFPFKYKENIAYTKLSSINGQAISIYENGKASVKLNKHGIIHIMPVTIKNNLAVIGKISQVVHLQEVKNIKSKYQDGKVFLNWDYPLGAEEVEIEYVNSINVSERFNVVVSKKEYELRKGFVIEEVNQNWPEMDMYIKTKFNADNQIKYSEGERIIVKLKKTIIDFEVKRMKSFGSFLGKRKLKFEITVRIDGFLNIPLMLVVKENNKLISYSDLNRTKLVEFDHHHIEGSAYQTICSYEPVIKNTKALFFSIIPVNIIDKEEIQINANGKKINI